MMISGSTITFPEQPVHVEDGVKQSKSYGAISHKDCPASNSLQISSGTMIFNRYFSHYDTTILSVSFVAIFSSKQFQLQCTQ